MTKWCFDMPHEEITPADFVRGVEYPSRGIRDSIDVADEVKMAIEYKQWGVPVSACGAVLGIPRHGRCIDFGYDFG